MVLMWLHMRSTPSRSSSNSDRVNVSGYTRSDGTYSAFNLEEPLFIPRVVCVVSPHNFLHSPFYCINADCNYEDEKMQDTRYSTALSH